MAEHLAQDVDPRLAQSVVDSTSGADGVTTIANSHGVDVAATIPRSEVNNIDTADTAAKNGPSGGDASFKDGKEDDSSEKSSAPKLAAVRKPPVVKSMSLNKAFLSGNAATTPQLGSGKLSLSLDRGSKGIGSGPAAAAAAAKPRLVSKIGPTGSRIGGIGQLGGKTTPSVWNRNLPPAPVPAKEYTDEELSKVGIHMAERIHNEDSKEAKWADIDDDDDNWVPPDTIEWNDGTKVTLDAAESPKPTVSAFEKQIGHVALKEQQKLPISANAHGPPKPMDSQALRNMEYLPSAPPSKAPWASVPPGTFPTPRPVPPPNQQFGGRPPGNGVPRQVLVNTQPTREVASDDFHRPSWRDRPAQSPTTLFNSETGNFEPVGDANPANRTQSRRNSRADSQGNVRPTAVLQRGTGRSEAGSEHEMPFQNQRYPGRNEGEPYHHHGGPGPIDSGRRRSASIRSAGMSDASSTTRDHRHQAPIHNMVNISSGGAAESQPIRPNQGPLYVSPTVAGGDPRFGRTPSQTGQLPNGIEVVPEPGENPVEAQKRVMKDAREQARARRLAEEAAAEEEKRQRILKKLAELDEKMKSETPPATEGDNAPSSTIVKIDDAEASKMPDVEPQATSSHGSRHEYPASPPSAGNNAVHSNDGVAATAQNNMNGLNGSHNNNNSRFVGRPGHQPQMNGTSPAASLPHLASSTSGQHYHHPTQQQHSAASQPSSQASTDQSIHPHPSTLPNSSSSFHQPPTRSPQNGNSQTPFSPTKAFSHTSSNNNYNSNNNSSYHQHHHSNYPTSPPLPTHSSTSPSHHYNSRPYDNHHHRTQLSPSLGRPTHFSPPTSSESTFGNQRDHNKPSLSQSYGQQDRFPSQQQSPSSHMMASERVPSMQIDDHVSLTGMGIPPPPDLEGKDEKIGDTWKPNGMTKASPWAPLTTEQHVRRFNMFTIPVDGKPPMIPGGGSVLPDDIPAHMMNQKVPGSSFTYAEAKRNRENLALEKAQRERFDRHSEYQESQAALKKVVGVIDKEQTAPTKIRFNVVEDEGKGWGGASRAPQKASGDGSKENKVSTAAAFDKIQSQILSTIDTLERSKGTSTQTSVIGHGRDIEKSSGDAQVPLNKTGKLQDDKKREQKPKGKQAMNNGRDASVLSSVDPNLKVTSKPAFEGADYAKPKVSIPVMKKAPAVVTPPPIVPQEPEDPNTRPMEDEFNAMAFQQEFGSTPTVCLPIDRRAPKPEENVNAQNGSRPGLKKGPIKNRPSKQPETVTREAFDFSQLEEGDEAKFVRVKLFPDSKPAQFALPQSYVNRVKYSHPQGQSGPKHRGGQNQKRGHSDGQPPFHQGQTPRGHRNDSGPSRGRGGGNRRGGGYSNGPHGGSLLSAVPTTPA